MEFKICELKMNKLKVEIMSYCKCVRSFLSLFGWLFKSKGILFVENHRTQTQFEDSLILKLFGFQFVNSYSSLYYIAFFREVSNLIFWSFLHSILQVFCFEAKRLHALAYIVPFGGKSKLLPFRLLFPCVL